MSTLPPPAPASPPESEPAGSRDGPSGATLGNPVDLERVAQDLLDVEVALDRLDQGTYWTCELTGAPLPDELLAADPLARRRPPASTSADAAPAAPGDTAGTW